MNNIKVCNLCAATNIETLIPRIKEVDANAEIEIGCVGFCGIGATKSFLILNSIPIIASSEDELIEKLKEQIK